MKVYTKGGDKGETSLLGGKRVSKADSRVDLYGRIDGLNSSVGYLNSFDLKFDTRQLNNIQNRLFDIGTFLASENMGDGKFDHKITAEDVKSFETDIDLMAKELSELKNFILPGGHPASAWSHVLRTQVRDMERVLIAFDKAGNDLPEIMLQYFNRLSDYFFIFARYVNLKEGIKDVIWDNK